MQITRNQSKYLRYLISKAFPGKAREYVRTVKGKRRKIGAICYCEKPGILVDFLISNVSVPLENMTAEKLITAAKEGKLESLAASGSVREIGMTAAAREACRLNGLDIPEGDSTAIIKKYATNTDVLDAYSEMLLRLGNPRTFDEIAAIFPAQRQFIMKTV